jgi:hypothetical protein
MKTGISEESLSQQLENYNVKLNWLKLSMLKKVEVEVLKNGDKKYFWTSYLWNI